MPISRIAVFALFVALLPFSQSVAFPFFSELLPNTEDDLNLEYFSVSNASCEPLALSGHSVSDAAGKTFVFSVEDVLLPRWTLTVSRSRSKIALNNENETLKIFDSAQTILDEFSYVSSSKGVPIVRTGFPVPECPFLESGTAFETATGTADPATDFDSSEAPVENSPVESSFSGSEGHSSIQAGMETSEEVELAQTGSTASWTESVSSDSPSPSFPSPPPSPPQVPGPLAASAMVFSTPSPVVPVSFSRASPDFVTISDTNGDGRFDTVEIRYSENLSGTASPEDFALYSQSGGLYAQKAATVPGYFSTARISKNLLILTLSGTVLEKSKLKVNASTSSEFRMKSLSSSKLLTESSGLPVQAITLTTSFSGYSSERIAFVPPPPEPASGISASSSDSVRFEEASDESSFNIFPNDSDGIESSRENGGFIGGSTSFVGDGDSVEPEIPSIPEGFGIVASAGVDRISPGKYRYVCFSSASCPVSFKVEGVPKGAKGYWEFSDGRIRHGASTSTLGKKPKATYSLSYVLKLSGGTIRFPLSLIVGGEELETISGSSSERESFVAATSAWLEYPSKIDASERMSDPLAPSQKSLAPPERSAFSSSVAKIVSAALAALFLWLFGGAWFSTRFRTWRLEETS